MTRLTALAITVVALALSACGGGGTAADTGGSAPAAGGSSTAQPAQGGTLTVGAAQGIPQLNPAIRTFAWEETLFPLMWNGLTKWQEDGALGPDLATKWEASDHLRTWTFHLREGVEFSNGKALTARDVVRTFEYYLKPKTATQEKNKIASISDIAAAGPTTVEIKLDAPNALLPEAVANVKILDVGSLGSINKEPAVTGPFMVKEFVPDDHVTLVRNERYFGHPAPLEEIRIVKAPDGTSAFTSLRSGDLDVLWSVPLANVAQLENDQTLRVVKPKVPSQYVSWEVDTTSAPFDDVRARQALAYATDRAAILKAAYFQQGVLSPSNTPLAPNNPWFGGEFTEYGYDLDKAKQLFAEAGVQEGDSLTWWGVAGQYPEWNTSGQILQASLKKIGIDLKIENHEVSSWAAKFYPAGQKFPNMVVPNFQSVPPEPAFSMNFLLKGRCECNWDSPEFEKAFQAAIAEPDAAARKEQWREVQTIINREAPLTIPVQATVATATKKDVTGAWVEGGGQLHLETAGLTKGA